MSVNNQVIILKNDKHKRKPFEVHENLCVDNEFEPDGETILKRFSTLIESIRYAKEYCNEYPYVEYGFTIYDSALKSHKNREEKNS